MTSITDATVVYVSSSKNSDYVEATPHEDTTEYIRANMVMPFVHKVAAGPYQGQVMELWIRDVMYDAAEIASKL